MLLAARTHARRALNQFLAAAQQATAVQERVLREKLRRCADSALGRDLGLRHVRTYADFVRQVPILSYVDFEPYVERVKNGEVQALFGPGTRVLMFAKTSGTTHRPKYVPVTQAFLREYRRGWNAFGVKVIHDHDCFLRPIVQVSSPMDEEYTRAGLPCGAVTGLMAATQKRLVRRYYVVPREVAYVADATTRYYCIVRLAAVHDVAFFVTASPATQLCLARTLGAHAEEIIRDVHDGTLRPPGEIPGDQRRRIARDLRPASAIARRLEGILARTGRLRPAEVWRLAFLANWTGGTMGLHLQDFPDYFGDVPVRDIGLIASEGRMTIPLEDGTPSGVLNVPDNFYEFVPAEEYGSTRPTTRRSHELDVGREYYILLTTSSGFLRYDIGDCVRVTGYHGQAPLLEFLHRGEHTSSLTGEKLTEQQVVLAFEACGATLAGALFVLAPRWGTPPHYCLHIEAAAVFDAEQRRRLAEDYDRQLQRINVEYASKRHSGRLGPIQVNVLPPGWLQLRDEHHASRQRAVNEQFKHRYLLNSVTADAAFPTIGEPQGPPAEERGVRRLA